MKQTILIILLATMFGCGGNQKEETSLRGYQSYNVEDVVTNSSLVANLLDVINYVDSLKKATPTYGDIKSFLITFSEYDNNCYLTIKGDFEYYDSKAMIGYFFYKDKTVSVYGIKNNCGDKFINVSKLRKGKIEGLIDFDHDNFNKSIKSNQLPPPPPPPREPYYRKYLIANKESLKLIDEYNMK